MEKYIIDFERINELTAHPKDDPDSGYAPFYTYNTTRNLIKQYMEVYQSYRNTSGRGRSLRGKEECEKYEEAVEILHFNKILISKSDMRDSKIDELLN
jgi:hypothetical protein